MAQNNLLEYQTHECTARQGHQKVENLLALNSDHQPASFDLRYPGSATKHAGVFDQLAH